MLILCCNNLFVLLFILSYYASLFYLFVLSPFLSKLLFFFSCFLFFLGDRAHHPLRAGGWRSYQDCDHHRGGGGGAGAGDRRGEGGEGCISPEKGKQGQGGTADWHKVNREKVDS